MTLILNCVGLFNDNVLDNIKELVNENNIDIEASNNEKNVDICGVENESSDNSLIKNNSNENDDNKNSKEIQNFKGLASEEKRLIDGDMIIIEKLNKRKKKKKIYIKIII